MGRGSYAGGMYLAIFIGTAIVSGLVLLAKHLVDLYEKRLKDTYPHRYPDHPDYPHSTLFGQGRQK